MIADVPRLEHGPACDFALDSQSPLVRSLGFKVRRNTGLVEGAWIENPGSQVCREQGANVGPGRNRRQRKSRGCRPGKGVEQGHRSRRCDIQVDVVERRVVCDAGSTADYRLSVAGKFAAKAQSPGKAHGRIPTTLRRG